MDIKYIKLVFFSWLLAVLQPCFGEQSSSQQQLTDSVGLKISSITFDCKQRKEKIPGSEEFEQRYRDITSKADAGVIDAGLRQMHFSTQDKRILVERSAIQYLCQEQIRNATAAAEQNIQVLLDLMMQRQLAERLVLISRNADIYSYLTAIKLMKDSQLDAMSRTEKDLLNHAKDADKQVRDEIALVENNLIQLVDELDKTNASLKGKKGVVCSTVGPYKVCYR